MLPKCHENLILKNSYKKSLIYKKNKDYIHKALVLYSLIFL